AVEVHGAHLGLVPLVETAVAARLLAAVGASGPLTRLAEGASATLRVTEEPGAAPVAFAAVADLVVTVDGDRVLVHDGPCGTPRATLAGLAVAAVAPAPDGAQEVGAGPGARDAVERARDEWRALTAVAQAGLARATLDLGVAYAKDRHQFGVPIASFQALQHRFADAHTRVDAAR